jgi:predicted Rossmann fold nucleotide-binding protein DprA/Smf involved in DNA uptake
VTAGKFPATHILAFEQDGKMVELLVMLEGEALYQADEWAGGAVAEWTFEDDGRLYFCGVDYAEERGKCTLRPVGHRGIPHDTLLMIVRQGRHSIADIARVMTCSLEEVSTAIATLERLGKLKRENEETVSPVWKAAT